MILFVDLQQIITPSEQNLAIGKDFIYSYPQCIQTLDVDTRPHLEILVHKIHFKYFRLQPANKLNCEVQLV